MGGTGYGSMVTRRMCFPSRVSCLRPNDGVGMSFVDRSRWASCCWISSNSESSPTPTGLPHFSTPTRTIPGRPEFPRSLAMAHTAWKMPSESLTDTFHSMRSLSVWRYSSSIFKVPRLVLSGNGSPRCVPLKSLQTVLALSRQFEAKQRFRGIAIASAAQFRRNPSLP